MTLNVSQFTYDGVPVLDGFLHAVGAVQERPKPQELPDVTHIFLQIPELKTTAEFRRAVQDLEAVLEGSEVEQ